MHLNSRSTNQDETWNLVHEFYPVQNSRITTTLMKIGKTVNKQLLHSIGWRKNKV